MKLQVKLNTNLDEFQKLIDKATELLKELKATIDEINNFELKASIEKDTTKKETNTELQLTCQPIKVECGNEINIENIAKKLADKMKNSTLGC